MRLTANDVGPEAFEQAPEAMGSSEVVMAHEEVVAPAAWSPLNLVHEQPTGVRLAHTSPVAKGGRRAPLPTSYDYTRSTAEVHRSDAPVFVGRFAEARAALDYTWHSYYTPERQAVQDRILEFFLERRSSHDEDAHLESISPPENLTACSTRGRGGSAQWVVFTAGPMGSGKSHTMKWLARRAIFPLDRFVHADPDLVRNQLPEIDGYIRADPQTAGSLTHREAGYIVEVLISVSLKRGYDVLVQGSLRDAAWHASYFNQLRATYAGIRIAIVHITAAKQTVLERARRRGETTKRVIPPDVLLASLEQTPRAVADLCPVVDYCVTINNEGSQPVVTTPGETLETFAEVWKPDCAALSPPPPSSSL